MIYANIFFLQIDNSPLHARILQAVLDKHLEFVAYDDCQSIIREAWLRCDVTGRLASHFCQPVFLAANQSCIYFVSLCDE